MNKERIFVCPTCGGICPAVGDWIARGIECEKCGQGFIPIERKTRVPRERQMFLPVWAWGLVAVIGTLLVTVILKGRLTFD